MHRTIRFLATLFLFAAFTVNVKAQATTVFTKYQDTLLNLANQVAAADNNEVRVAINAEFVQKLVNALKIPFSFNYKFDSLKNISIVKAPDNSFRLITWYLPMNDGTYRYYGTIQLSSPDGKLKLIPLLDDTPNFKDNNAIVGSKNWFGARYYDIVPVTSPGKAPYYVLLGWKGKSLKVASKVIEVLTIDKGIATFGKPVFDGTKTTVARNRMVYEYNRLNNMLLQRDNAVNMIVMDHLAPLDPEKKGNAEFYASDSSFDAFKIIGGRLKLLENVELRNPPSEMDAFYGDPVLLAPPKTRN